MQATPALLVALFALGIGTALPTVAETPVGLPDGAGVQLKSFREVYAAVTSGLVVRYYVDLTTCMGSSSKSIANYGGVIGSFEYFQRPETGSYVGFASEQLSLEPKAEMIVRDHIFYYFDLILINIVVMDPATFVPREKGQRQCTVNNGTAGSATFFTTTQQPPTLLTSYADVYSTLRSGSTVSFSADLSGCFPTPLYLTVDGGFIGSYQDVDAASSNPGVQFSKFRLTTSPLTGYDTLVVSLYQNGTVNFNRKLQTTAFIPITTQNVACTLSDGTNNGTVQLRRSASAKNQRIL